MNEEFRLHDSDVETLDLLLDAWEDAIENGHNPDPEVICRDAPHLLEEFKARIEKLSKMDQRLQPAPAPEAESADGTVIQRSAPEAVPSHAIEWQTDVSQLEYHAHGGLGIVFRGFDRQLHRVVAVKFIRERRRHIPIDAQRFRVEAEITSRLDHPGVAPVHGYGLTESGVPFYAMRLVEGKTLQQRIDSFHNRLRKEATPSDSSLEFRKLLNSFISVCNTIEYAHTRGVVNCDIKPGNVMLGKYGETVVLDWGCAKYVGSAGKAKSVGEESLKPLSDTANSNSGATGGTPIYMSPEQHLNSEEVGPSSDIYSLGATLYRIITGQPAFSPENSLAKIRETVIRGRFRKPTDICPWLSKSLEAVCLKAMALAPEDRYRSAEELARDLERYLADEEVEAYVEPFSRRVARLMRRHRGVSRVLFGSLAVLILFSMVFAGVMGQSATREAAARTKATDMRNRSLQVAARSAATSMALKINDAWRILEIEANSEQLRQQMLEKGTVDFEMGDWTEIQSWLVRRAEAQEVATHASSWFLCRADGTQVARYPLLDENGEMFGSIGENYSHRDYFHGNGHDLPEGAVGSPAHINQIHLSAAYRSSNTKDLKVAFSIPIWSDPAGTV
ncbi:MAG: protein kinase, partial [Planctomycetaceae bacterium]|nr:protein kinase [Planctomycetaceae bacterium]